MKLRNLLSEGISSNKKYAIKQSFAYIRTQMELLERELDSDLTDEQFKELCDNVIYGITEKTAQLERNLKK